MAASGKTKAERRLKEAPPKIAIAVIGAKLGAWGKNRNAAPKIMRTYPSHLLITDVLDEPLHHIPAAGLQLIRPHRRALAVDIKLPKLIFRGFNAADAFHHNTEVKLLFIDRCQFLEKHQGILAVFPRIADIVR